MNQPRGVWPDLPPEVPPPWRPGQPDQPDRRAPSPAVPLVVPAGERGPRDELGLLRRRIVLLAGPVDHHTATAVAAQVMALDADDDAPIRLQLSSDDGDLTAALMLADTVDLARSPVVACARGAVGSVALAPFCAATRRLATPNAHFRLREPLSSISGSPDELTSGAEAMRRQVDQLCEWVARATGRPRGDVAEDVRRGRLLTAQEAVDYGLVDEIESGRASGMA